MLIPICRVSGEILTSIFLGGKYLLTEAIGIKADWIPINKEVRQSFIDAVKAATG